MWMEDLKQHHIDAAESIVRKITLDPALAEEIVVEFRAKIEEQRDDDEGIVSLLDNVCEAGDWKCTYYVDWKDTDSFIGCVMKLSEKWDCSLTLSQRNSSHTVPDLIRLAHKELAKKGLGLWGWDTQGDCYSGWVGRLSDADFFQEVSRTLEVRISPEGADF